MVSSDHDPTDNYLDRVLKSEGLSAEVKMIVPQVFVALLSLKNNQFITHTVKRIVEPIAKQSGLMFLPISPEWKLAHESLYIAHQYWYKSSSDDPAHQWLRALIKEISQNEVQ